MRKCRIGTAKFFTLLLLLYRTSVNGADVILKGTVGEEWVTKLEKVIQTYTKADGSELTAEDFTADTYRCV